jgi:hypothetical protein
MKGNGEQEGGEEERRREDGMGRRVADGLVDLVGGPDVVV